MTEVHPFYETHRSAMEAAMRERLDLAEAMLRERAHLSDIDGIRREVMDEFEIVLTQMPYVGGAASRMGADIGWDRRGGDGGGTRGRRGNGQRISGLAHGFAGRCVAGKEREGTCAGLDRNGAGPARMADAMRRIECCMNL